MNTSVSSVRLPNEVRDYFKEKGIKLRDILEDIYHDMKQNELPKLENDIAELKKIVLQKEEIVVQLKEHKLKKDNKHVSQVRGIVMNSYNPDFYIGKTINDVKVTKKQLNIWKKEQGNVR